MPYANIEDRRNYFRKYREEHRERFRELNRKYKQARRKQAQRKPRIYKDWKKVDTLNKRIMRQLLKEEVLTHYGHNKCACVRCGMDDIRCLSIDHIRSNGAREREKVGGGSRLYVWLKKMGYPEGYQTLCLNCQFIKRAELKEYGQGRNIPKNQSALPL